MIKAIITLTLLGALLMFSGRALLAGAPETTSVFFPISTGTYWTYQGTLRWTHDTNQFSEAKITWRAEIRRTLVKGNTKVAVMNGFPSDLDWGDDKTTASDSLLIESDNRLYWISGDRSADVLDKIEKHSGDISEIIRADDLFLKWPLRVGEQYSCDSTTARPDTFYCWFVAASSPTDLSGVKGIPIHKHDSFSIVYRTMPDHIQFSFVSGVGITKYEYHHHGTVADTELSLLSIHEAP